MRKNNIFNLIGGLLLVALVGCGGGGGSAGTPSGGSGSTASTGTTTVGTPTLSIVLANSAGVATNLISASGLVFAKVTLKDSSGIAITATKVTFSGDALLIKISPANDVLTDSSGVATVQISAASLNARGAGTLIASALVAGVAVTGNIDFQLSSANLTLSTLDVGSSLGVLAALGNRTVATIANIDGVPATSTPVQITFAATCGSVSPTIVITDGSGRASTTYSANSVNCAGTNVIVTASAVGATPQTGTIAVAGTVATNIQFISTTPQLIYLKDSVGTTQALVVFRAVDSVGNALQFKKLRLSLSNVSTGVSLNTVGNILPVDLTTDAAGQVTAAVFSGTVPTSLNIRATLLSDSNQPTSVFSDSNLLTVASGRPSQKSQSLSVEKLSIEGANTDGVSTSVTFSMADRQGNPVPPGTQVNFVTESGVFLPAVCFVPPPLAATASSPAVPSSSCTVSLRSQGNRTLNGRVSILAYVVGEEDFVDANGNNMYDCGESFTDLGFAFRDDNGTADRAGANNAFDNGEFQVPRIASSSACLAAKNPLPVGALFGVPGTNDGIWGATDVRQQGFVVFATGEAVLSAVSQTGNNLIYTVADRNGNSVPTGSTIAVSGSAACAVENGASTIVPNSLSPATFSVRYAVSAGAPCLGGTAITVRVTSPLGLVTTRSFTVPATPPAALSVLSGTTASVISGSSRLTTVSGGTGPYSVSSSSIAIATATISGSALTITGVAEGTSRVIVSDATGAEFTIIVTVN